MTTIFIAENNIGHGEESYARIAECVAHFCEVRGLTRSSYVISTAESGKPCFIDEPGDDHIEFSVSNSGRYWVLAVSTEPCGIDVQVIGDNDWGAIAERWFKPAERSYVEREGEAGFYRIWVRREAYGKMTGEGFFGSIALLADEEGKLLDKVPAPDGLAEPVKEAETEPENKKTALFADLMIAGADDGVYCSVCSFDRPEDLRTVFIDV